jgi:Mg-chelatase subunit ChlD
VFDVTGGAGSGPFVGTDPRAPVQRQIADHPGAGTGVTEEDGALGAVPELRTVDPAVRAAAREIIARLWLRRPVSAVARRGSGAIRSVRYRPGLDDIDLDRTLEVMAEHPLIGDEDVIVHEPVTMRRPVVLAVDISGSMRDDRLRTAAATVGALAAELPAGDLAVVAFWSDAAWLGHLGTRADPMRLLDVLAALPARGLTNVALPLELAVGELRGQPFREARAILLSDCVHNAGPDPRPLAAGLPRLDVLLDLSGERDVELARELAGEGRGRLRAIRDYRDVAAALGDLFAPAR